MENTRQNYIGRINYKTYAKKNNEQKNCISLAFSISENFDCY